MPEKSPKIILDIIPLTRISLARQQHFSYLWDGEVPVGSLVSIPLFRRNVEGIVIGNRNDFERFGHIKLRRINSVLEEGFLSAQQLELARFISEYYFAPLGIVLKSFIPRRVKTRNKQETINKKQNFKKIILTKEQCEAVDQITKEPTSYKLKAKSFLLYGPASSGKTEVYANAISKSKIQSPKSQFLILLPELTLTPQAIERYGEYFQSEETVLLHSKLSKGQLFANWEKIRSGEAKIIIGTRLAVFAPFQNLKLIVIDEEQDISYKQWDMTPRYDARKVAEKLAELHQAKIVLGSATPSLESYHKALNKEYTLLNLPKLKLTETDYQIPETKMEVVDMRKERWKKKNQAAPILSEKLLAEIEYNLKHQRQIILFVNRRGMSSFSVCVQCKAVLRCPQCERALIFNKEGVYRCLHCNYQSDVLATCPHCQGGAFKNIGIGTEKIEREINSRFASARILRVDFQAMTKKGALENLYQDFSQKKADIIIGTQMITKGWDLPSVGLIGIIDADELFSIPDFKTDEKAVQNILQVSGRTSRLGSDFSGTVVIQTYRPEHPVVRFSAEQNYLGFYAEAIKEREALHYPPFGQLIKIILQDQRRNWVDQETEKVFIELEKLAAKEASVSVLPPQNPLLANIRGKYRKQIILKINQPIPASLRRFIDRLGSGWLIDVDPISIT